MIILQKHKTKVQKDIHNDFDFHKKMSSLLVAWKRKKNQQPLTYHNCGHNQDPCDLSLDPEKLQPCYSLPC
jgi:hypothetical protein